MAYLPAEKIVMQANLFDTHEPPPADADAGDDDVLSHDAGAEARRGDDRAGARPTGAALGVHEGDGDGRAAIRALTRYTKGPVRNNLIIVAADASRRAALLVAYIRPVCALLAPCRAGASTPTMTNLFLTGP